VTDGGVPPWSPDMSGRVVADTVVELRPGWRRVTVPLTAAQRAALARDGSALVSFETAAGEVQALDLAVK